MLPSFRGSVCSGMDFLHFKKRGGQHLPECHKAFPKSYGKSFRIFTSGGGQHVPDYPVVDLLNNMNELAEDSEKVLVNFQRNVNLFDAEELKNMAT